MTISVFTPCRNPGTLLDLSVDSLRRQNLPPGVSLEHWVIDGSSTDGTVKKLERWQAEGLLLFVSERDKSMTEAMNKALKRIRGELVGQLNAGDIYADSALEYVAAHFRKRPYDMCFYGGTTRFPTMTIKRVPKFMTSELGMTFFDCQAYSSSVFFRRSLIEEIGVFDESLAYSQDVEFYLRAIRAGKNVVYDSFPVSEAIIAKGQLGVEYSDRQKRDVMKIIKYPRLYSLARRAPMGIILHLTGGMVFPSVKSLIEYYSRRILKKPLA